MFARRALLAGGAVIAIAVAGCGGGGKRGGSAATPSSAGGAQKLSLTADPGGQLKYDKQALRARAGRLTIVMANPSALSHSVAIEGNGVSAAGEVVAQAATSTVSANLKPGTYTFFCTVPGHRAAGMQGTLTVK
jgi:plastocyanin